MARNLGGLQIIAKLEGRENYQDWALNMRAILEIDEVWCTIQGEPRSTDPVKIAKARSKMILSMAKSTYSNIRTTEGAKDLWDKLKAAYETRGHSRRCGLMADLMLTRLVDCPTPEDYVEKICVAAENLAGINLPVSDEWLASILMWGLPADFQPMCIAIESRQGDLTSDVIKEQIYETASVLDRNQQMEERALVTRSRQSSFPRNGSRNGRTYPQNTYNNNNNFGGRGKFVNKQTTRGRGTCLRCGRLGHFERQCNARTRVQIVEIKEDDPELQHNEFDGGDFTDEAANNVYVSGEIDHASRAYVNPVFVPAYAVEVNNYHKWYVDSAASRHMCNNKSLFTEVRKSNIKHVVVANGQNLNVVGQGTIVLQIECKNVTRKWYFEDVLYIPDIASNLNFFNI